MDKWLHPRVAAIKQEILAYTKQVLMQEELPSAVSLMEKVMTVSLPVPFSDVIVRNEDGETDLYGPDDISRYSKSLPTPIRYGLEDSIGRAFQHWQMEATHSTEDPWSTLSSLVEFLLMRTYNIALMNAFSDGYVVIPRINDGAVCCECETFLEGKVYYISPSMISDPTPQEFEQSLWINKDLVKSPLTFTTSRAVPLHRGCRHIIALYKGGDPYDYYVKA